MIYKMRMVFLKVLFVPLAIVSALVVIPTIFFGYALYGILHAWRWIVRESIDEELTVAWNELAESTGIENLVIEF